VVISDVLDSHADKLKDIKPITTFTEEYTVQQGNNGDNGDSSEKTYKINEVTQ